MKEELTLWSKFTAIALKILVIVWAFISPIALVLLAVGMIIILDTIIGVWKAKKINQKVTSRRLSRVIKKMFIYQCTVLTFYVIDYSIFHDIVIQFFQFDYALTKIIAVVLMSIEAYSIDESFQQATGKGLIERLKGLISKYKDVKESLPTKED